MAIAPGRIRSAFVRSNVGAPTSSIVTPPVPVRPTFDSQIITMDSTSLTMDSN